MGKEAASLNIKSFFFLSENLQCEVLVCDRNSHHHLVYISASIQAKFLTKLSVTHVFDFTKVDDTAILDYLELTLDSMSQDNDVEQL